MQALSDENWTKLNQNNMGELTVFPQQSKILRSSSFTAHENSSFQQPYLGLAFLNVYQNIFPVAAETGL